MINGIFIAGALLIALSACSDPVSQASAPQAIPQKSTKKICAKTGIPTVSAVLTAEGVVIWDSLVELPARKRGYDAIEIHGTNLCSGTLTLADGVHPAQPLPYTIIEGGNIRIELPWNLPRVDTNILFRTKRSFTKLSISLLPFNDLNLVRQIYVNKITRQTF